MLDIFLVQAQLDDLEQDEDGVEGEAELQATGEALFEVCAAFSRNKAAKVLP